MFKVTGTGSEFAQVEDSRQCWDYDMNLMGECSIKITNSEADAAEC